MVMGEMITGKAANDMGKTANNMGKMANSESKEQIL